MEHIGKVTMNYDYYSGKDLYSDGDIEDTLLEIVKNHDKSEFPEIIAEKKSWPVLYHLSDVRTNILNWYPFKKDANVLEVGAGCGAITGTLADKTARVTAVDLSKRRSLINAYRNKDKENLEIIIGNFYDISSAMKERYDYVTLIGVLEYGECYIPGENAYQAFLEKIKGLLKPDGKVLIAIENQLGLKYFAGCKEDHVGRYFEGIEGYTNTSGVRTFSKKALADLLAQSGYEGLEFYYPYPDYKLPDTIYTDDFLPAKGELCRNSRNFDADRMVLFNETKAWDTIIEAGLFPEFSNSFFVVATKKG
jgi:2-polyprenyl-3-methyl-5-hydroxy-6-metoxy-1,4-benzoquinol methylase